MAGYHGTDDQANNNKETIVQQQIRAKDWAERIQYVQTVDHMKFDMPANPNANRTRDGYTTIKGAPTRFKVKVNGSGRWLRVYVLCFSNALSFFVNLEGERHYLNGQHLMGTEFVDRRVTLVPSFEDDSVYRVVDATDTHLTLQRLDNPNEQTLALPSHVEVIKPKYL